MQKSLRSFAEKLFLPVSFSVVLLLSGCGGTIGDKDTDEAKQYELSQAIDAGEWDKAIAMLEEDCAGYDARACATNLSAAYLGKGGIDVISFAQVMLPIDANDSLSKDQKSEEKKNKLTEMFDNAYPRYGMRVMKNYIRENNVYAHISGASTLSSTGIDIEDEEANFALVGSENWKTICTSYNYEYIFTDSDDTLKAACLIINPEMIVEINDKNYKTTGKDMEEALGAFGLTRAALSPESSLKDLISSTLTVGTATTNDVNGNGKFDSMDVTGCVTASYDGSTSGIPACSEANVVMEKAKTVDFTNGTDTTTLSVVFVNVSSIDSANYADRNFTRLAENIPTTTSYTVVSQQVNADSEPQYCEADFTPCSAADYDNGCYPCPVVKSDGSVATFNDTVTDIFNDDSKLESLAVMLDEDTTATTSTEQVAALREKVCEDDSGNPTGLCTVDPTATGGYIVTESALIDYFTSN